MYRHVNVNIALRHELYRGAQQGQDMQDACMDPAYCGKVTPGDQYTMCRATLNIQQKADLLPYTAANTMLLTDTKFRLMKLTI